MVCKNRLEVGTLLTGDGLVPELNSMQSIFPNEANETSEGLSKGESHHIWYGKVLYGTYAPNVQIVVRTFGAYVQFCHEITLNKINRYI